MSQEEETWASTRRDFFQHALWFGAVAPLLPNIALASAEANQGQLVEIETLRTAWREFCHRLESLGDLPGENTLASNAQDHAAGYLQLFRNLSLAFDFQHEYNNPLFPEFFRYFGPTRKQGGDNCDCNYVGAAISGDYRYRIAGDRGTSRYFSVVLVEEGDTPWGGRVVASIFGNEIETDENGHFELIIAQNEHEGNWLKSTNKTFRVTIRQYFADWERERPMRALIERISGPEQDPPTVSGQQLAVGLTKAVQWLGESVKYWPMMLQKWQSSRNTFKSYWQLEDNAIDATPGGDPLVCYWALEEDEALIVRVRPPQCHYWNVEFGNCWWETTDYRYRLANTNMHYAELEEDGELIVVIAHQDPGVPNWLDCSGFSRGYVTFRWMLSEEHPVPEASQVYLQELFANLPNRVRRISVQERKEQLKIRRRGILARFGY